MIRLDKTHFYFAAILFIQKKMIQTEILLEEIKKHRAEMQTSPFRVEMNWWKSNSNYIEMKDLY